MNVSFEFCDFENPEHLEAVANLTNHYMADPMGGVLPLNKIQQLRLVDSLANHPSCLVLLLITDNEVAGLATCFINFSTFHIKPYLNVHDIIVHSNHRGKGLGKRLMKELISIAQKRNYCKITLEVRDDNTIAQALYRSLGFEESKPNMYFWTKKIETKLTDTGCTCH